GYDVISGGDRHGAVRTEGERPAVEHAGAVPARQVARDVEPALLVLELQAAFVSVAAPEGVRIHRQLGTNLAGPDRGGQQRDHPGRVLHEAPVLSGRCAAVRGKRRCGFFSNYRLCGGRVQGGSGEILVGRRTLGGRAVRGPSLPLPANLRRGSVIVLAAAR